MKNGVSSSQQQAAEEIRAHLVALRGGAPFLSPADARLLVQWLDDGIAVSAVLCALERAAEARRKRRSRIPLALHHAKRHLGKPTPGARPALAAPASADAHPLEPLVLLIEKQARGDRRESALRELVTVLRTLPFDDPEVLLRDAIAATRAFHEVAWFRLDDGERLRRLAGARDELGDLVDANDPASEGAVEEVARDRLREEYPLLTAATLWNVVEG